MNKKTIRDIDLKGKKVFVRCDFNVPLDEQGNITDNRRIVGALPTINYLLEQNCKIILSSHLGRPKGEPKPEFSLLPVQKELSKLLDREIKLAKDVVGESAKELTSNMQDGEIVLLENVRFDSREEKNDESLSKEFANMAEVFVNDAFGTAHRAHSSTAGIADYLPAVSGFLIEKELNFLGSALDEPKRPFIAIIGGKKVSDKITVIESLLDKVDTLIIGGGMAYTFFKSKGYEVGKSVCELDKLDMARDIMKKAEEKGVKLVLPVDNLVADDFSETANTQIVDSNKIPADWEGLDIGTKTVDIYAEELKKAKTIMWNGPVGVFEINLFAQGTNAIAKILGDLDDCITIIGGGDSAAAIEKAGLADKMTHISTGGGASLEFLEGKKLPGIECLQDK